MPPKKPTPDDLTLWQQAMRDVRRLLGKTEEVPSEVSLSLHVPQNARRPPAAVVLPEPNWGLKTPPENPQSPGIGIDRRTEDRFRRGQMEIEARLDLHGLTLNEAEPAVHQFIRIQHASGRRCLLIITGKGQQQTADTARAWYESPKGQIRRQLKHWLDSATVKHLILSIAPARPQHGGEGAFYILLRRQR